MLPTRLPVPLPGGSADRAGASDVRPSSQWVEPARSGAAMAVTVLDIVQPGFYYSTQAAAENIASVWLRREAGPISETVSVTLRINGYYRGEAIVPPGQTEVLRVFGIDLLPGDVVQLYAYGANESVVSGVMRTPSRLFRMAPAALGKVWVMADGEWVAPPRPYVKNAGAWQQAPVYVKTGGAWVPLIT